MCESCFYVHAIQTICFCTRSDDFCSDSTLILTTAMKLCMDTGARPHVWSFFNVFNVCVNSQIVYAVLGLYILSCVGAIVGVVGGDKKGTQCLGV
jgi:hypothetical protein